MKDETIWRGWIKMDSSSSLQLLNKCLNILVCSLLSFCPGVFDLRLSFFHSLFALKKMNGISRIK